MGRKRIDQMQYAAFVPQRLLTGDISAQAVCSTTGPLLFVDISGFTSLTQRLSIIGQEGAEQLTAGINRYFSRLIRVLAQHGGDVLKFGGDAVLVGFPPETPLQTALTCCTVLHQEAYNHRRLETPLGTFTLGLHIGISCGTYYDLICDCEGYRHEHIVFGRPAHTCQQAADLAGDGETVGFLPESRRRDLPPPAFRRLRPGFYKLSLPQKYPIPREHGRQERVEQLLAAALFLDPAVRELVAQRSEDWIGEHRKVSVVFAFLKSAHPWLNQNDGTGMQAVGDVCCKLARQWETTWSRSDPGATYHKFLFLFGAPQTGEKDECRAVGFARDLQLHLAKLVPDGNPLNFGIGIASGRVFCGFVGSPERREYTVMGNAANLAARLAAKSMRRKISVDRATVHQSAHRFRFRKLRPVAVKGRSGTIEVYRPLNERPAQQTKVDEYRHLYYPKQLDALHALTSHIPRGTGIGVVISGEAGCGKSTFINVGLRRLKIIEKQTAIVTVWPEDQQLAFSGLAKILNEYLQSPPTELADRRAELIKRWPQTLDRGLLPLVAEVIGVRVSPTARAKALTQKARLQQLGELLPVLIDHLKPTEHRALVLDNYQWMDPTSRQVLEYWWLHAQQFSLLLLAGTRTALAFSADIWKNITAIELGAVREDALLSLITSRFPGAEIPSRLTTKLKEVSKSVPAVADAYLDYWIEEAVIYLDPRNQQRLHVDHLEITDIPDALLASYVRRLDRLPPEQAEVIRGLAVWGTGADERALRKVLSDTPALDFSGTIARLARQGIVEKRAAGKKTQCSITHPLLARAAYQTMSYSRRRALHTAAATIWRKRRGARAAVNLARHLLAAGEYAEAVPSLMAAAEYATKSGAFLEARDFLQKAAGIKPRYKSPDVQIEIRRSLATLEQELGDYTAARRHYDQALRRARKIGNRHQTLSVQLSLGRLYWLAGWYDRCAQIVQNILNARGTAVDTTITARARLLKSELFRRRGSFDQAEAEAKTALTLFQKINDTDGLQDVQNTLGIVCWAQGRLGDAADHFRGILKLGKRVVDPASRARIDNNLGILYEEQAQLLRAERYYQQAFEAFAAIGHRRNRAYCLGNLSNIQRLRGNFDAAFAGYQEVLRETQAIGEAHAHAYTLGNMGDLYADCGAFDQAMPYFRKTMTFARRAQDDELHAETLLRIASAKRAAGCARHWNKLLADAARLAEAANSEEFQIKAELLTLADRGKGSRPVERIDHLKQLLERSEKARLHYYALSVREELAHQYYRAGDLPAACRMIVQAIATSYRAGYHVFTVRLTDRLLRLLSAAQETGTVIRIRDHWRKQIGRGLTMRAQILEASADPTLRRSFEKLYQCGVSSAVLHRA